MDFNFFEVWSHILYFWWWEEMYTVCMNVWVMPLPKKCTNFYYHHGYVYFYVFHKDQVFPYSVHFNSWYEKKIVQIDHNCWLLYTLYFINSISRPRFSIFPIVVSDFPFLTWSAKNDLQNRFNSEIFVSVELVFSQFYNPPFCSGVLVGQSVGMLSL